MVLLTKYTKLKDKLSIGAKFYGPTDQIHVAEGQTIHRSEVIDEIGKRDRQIDNQPI